MDGFSQGSASTKQKIPPILRTGYFTVLIPEAPTQALQCNLCMKTLRGPQTSNFITHLKMKHPTQYESYESMKNGHEYSLEAGPSPFTSDVSDMDMDRGGSDIGKSQRNILFDGGFFKIVEQIDQRRIRSICLSCQRIGKEHTLLSLLGTTSNLITHLNRMHPDEYERYMQMKQQRARRAISSAVFDSNEFGMQSAETLVKSEKLEYVEMNQGQHPFDIDDWNESIDSSNINEDAFNQFDDESNTADYNEEFNNTNFCDVQIKTDPDASTSNADPSNRYDSILFKKNFFRFIDSDGKIMRAECLLCSTVKKSSAKTTSNFVMHLKRMHQKAYLAYKNRPEIPKYSDIDRPVIPQIMPQFTQMHFNRIVTDFMISGMHPPCLLEDRTFAKLLNDIAMHRTTELPIEMNYRLMSIEDLNKTINEMVASTEIEIKTIFNDVKGVSMNVDICLLNGKCLIVVVANWINSTNFKRNSQILATETFNLANETTSQRLCAIYTKYGLNRKIIATVNKNASALKDILFMNKTHGSQIINYIDVEDQPNLIENPIFSFEMIGTKDADKALNDTHYSMKYRIAFEKVKGLRKYAQNLNLTQQTSHLLMNIFPQTATISKCVQVYNQLINLTSLREENLNEICDELNVPYFIETDFEFLKEFNMVLEPIVNAIEYLEKPDCYFAAYLPMVYSAKDSLIALKTNNILRHCEPLLMAILNGLDERFAHFFKLDDRKCISPLIATCTHPFFKTRWLKDELKLMQSNRILQILEEAAKRFEGKNESSKSLNDEGTSTSEHKQPQQKKFKFSFESCDGPKTDENSIDRHDLMAFLGKPCPDNCDDLDQIKYYPCIQKLFMRFNSIPCSSSPLSTQSISFLDLIRKAQSGQFNDDIFGKLGLLASRTNLK